MQQGKDMITTCFKSVLVFCVGKSGFVLLQVLKCTFGNVSFGFTQSFKTRISCFCNSENGRFVYDDVIFVLCGLKQLVSVKTASV